MSVKLKAVKLNKVKILKTDRKNTIKIFEDYFIELIAIEIERGIYTRTKDHCYVNSIEYQTHAVYHDIVGNLVFTLKQKCASTKKLLKKINNGKINPYCLAYLRPHDLNPENWERIISRIKTTEKQLNNLPTETGNPCKNCKGTKYIRYQLQTRSADEPMTQFYECKQCGRTKRVNN